jgi:hypothetical protein
VLAVPNGKKNLCVQNCPLLRHIADRFPNPRYAAITTLPRTGIDTTQSRIHLAVRLQKCGRCTFGVAHGMEVVDDKLCACKKYRFPRHAVGPQCTGKIIDNPLRRLFPPSNQCGKHIITSLALGDAMESIADAMGAPYTHNPPCQALLPILRIELGAFCPSFTAHICTSVML